MSTMVDNSRWDQRYQNQQGPITSGFVSNSDIRQKEKQEQIRLERQREYQDIMNKPREPNNSRQGSREQHQPPVYYKTGGVSELSLPLGNYEESRRVLDDERQREYNIYMTQKKDAENKRREDLYLNARQNYKAPPEPDMYDHNQISKDLREERQSEYNDYLKKKQSEESSRIRHRHRYTPPGGLPIGQYDLQRKKLQQQLRSEYKESLLKREKENMQSRRHVPPTPPGGLNIATEQERKQVENLKKAQYRDELLKQQKEQLYNTARQQGEIPVLNRSSPTRAPPDQISPRGRPPPHPDSVRQRDQPHQDDRMGQNHMEQSRQTPNFWDEGRQAPSPKSVEDEQATYNKSHVVDSQNKSKQNDRRPQEEIRTGLFDDRRRTPQNRDERQQDYQDYLADKLKKDEIRRQKLDEMRQAPQPGVNKGAYYDSDTYEQKRHSLNSQRREEYQDFLSKKSPDQRERRQWNDHSDPKGIIAGIDSYNYEKRKIFADERKQEYKDIMEKRNKPETDTQTYPEDTTKDESSVDRKPDMESINLNAVKIFPVGEGYTKKQRELQAERKKNDKAFALKKNEVYKKQKEDRDSFREMLDRELMESPPIIPNGEYDTKKRHFQQEAHKEMVHFLERQPHSNRDKEFWSKTAKPRILPQSGEYKNRKQKLNDELRKDWRDYILKQEPPKERIKEFGSPGAVLFTGEYEKTRQKVREERTKDYHEFMKKYGQQQPKRVPEQPPANSIGFMANLGFHDQERDKLNKEKRDEYNKFLDEDSWYNQEPPPFNKSPGPGRDQEPPRERPGSFNRRPSPSYQEILDSKRRQEASYRRFDDQEYSRLGGPQGGLGTDYSRP